MTAHTASTGKAKNKAVSIQADAAVLQRNSPVDVWVQISSAKQIQRNQCLSQSAETVPMVALLPVSGGVQRRSCVL